MGTMPLPVKGSTTISPGSVKRLIQVSAAWVLSPHMWVLLRLPPPVTSSGIQLFRFGPPGLANQR